MESEETLFPYLCVHAPRKEYIGKYPIKISIVMARGPKQALAEFTPFHPNEPFIKHYKKPYVTSGIYAHYIEGRSQA